MILTKRELEKILNDKDKNIEERIGIYYVLNGIISGLCGLAICLFSSISKYGLFIVVFIVLFTTIICALARKGVISLEKERLLITLEVVLLIPMIYLTGGGLESGCPIWFIYQILYIVVSSKGKTQRNYLFAAVGFDIWCVVTEIFFPELVYHIQTRTGIMFSTIGSIVIVSVSIYKLINTYKSMLSKEIDKSQKLYDELDDAYKREKDFFSLMSHEIRTPLNAVINMNNMIAEENNGENKTIESLAKDVKSSGELLLSIVNDILNISKIDKKAVTFESLPYDVDSMVNKVVSMLKPKANEKGIRLILNMNKQQLPKVLIGDEMKIEQILINLVNNAIKYTDSGYVEIDVYGVFLDNESYNLLMEVSDSGIGISEEDIPNVFSSFTRTDMKRNSKIEGTGLGLAVVKGFVEGMNGTIKCHSKKGEHHGSVFIVNLEQGFSDKEPIQKLTAQEMVDDCLKNRSVLACDDVDINTKIMRMLLEKKGVIVTTTTNPEEAISLTSIKEYDAILMDIIMPKMDGYEATSAILQQRPDSKVIAMTGDDTSDIEPYIRAGFVAALSKPIDPNVLENTLKNVIMVNNSDGID